MINGFDTVRRIGRIDDIGGVSVIYGYSRMVVDPERFESDQEEIMASKGMGVIYTKTSNGNKLRANPSEDEREELVDLFYRPYHAAVEHEVQSLIDTFGNCLILDCHSFPSIPLPYEINQDSNRPDICLGTDPYHTPKELIEITQNLLRKYNLTTALNAPFEGTYVPMKFLRTDRRVSSLMIEINRRLYMDEKIGEKSDSFNNTQKIITNMLRHIATKYFSTLDS